MSNADPIDARLSPDRLRDRVQGVADNPPDSAYPELPQTRNDQFRNGSHIGTLEPTGASGSSRLQLRVGRRADSGEDLTPAGGPRPRRPDRGPRRPGHGR